MITLDVLDGARPTAAAPCADVRLGGETEPSKQAAAADHADKDAHPTTRRNPLRV